MRKDWVTKVIRAMFRLQIPRAGRWRNSPGLPSTYEGFVPYESASQAAANSAEKTTIFTRSVNVPQHRKYTLILSSTLRMILAHL